VAAVSDVLRAAIRWAMDNRDEVIRTIAAEERGDAGLADPGLLDRYLGMYANHDTAEMAPDVRRAIDVLFTRARAAGLLAEDTRIEWAP
jgi:predicted solute-binding protein